MKNLPQGVTQPADGQSENMAELLASFGGAMLAGIGLIFAILVLLFKSFFKPVTIVAALPLSLAGAFDMGSALWSARMARNDRRRAMSALVFAQRTAKTMLVTVALVAVLDTVRVNVTTGIAAQGIGGLALALGAQKTIDFAISLEMREQVLLKIMVAIAAEGASIAFPTQTIIMKAR